MNEIISKLINIGLTQTQAKVYLFLLQHKEAKAGIICKKSNIPSSHIYDILDKLLEKGLISFKIINNVKTYRPVNPESLFSIIKEKERQLEKEKSELKDFISSLKKIEIQESKEHDFKYFEGINGVRSMFNEFAESWKPNSRVYIASASIAYEKWNAFLMEYFHKPRIKKKVHQQLIVPKRIMKYGKEREKLKLIDIKYTDIEQETEFGVSGDYVYFLSQFENPSENKFELQKYFIFNFLL